MKTTPIILIDRREKIPWEFHNLSSEPATLAAGDYSVKNLAHLVAIERKSLDDLLKCVSGARGRFRREMQRLRSYRFRALIIEASHAGLERGNWRSRLLPSQVLGSLSAWMAQFDLPIWLAGDREAAARFAEKYLFQCTRLIAHENTAVGAGEQCVA